MQKWIFLYNKISHYIDEFGKTLNNIEINDVDDAAESFVLMCLKLCQKDSEAIALLLGKGLYCQAMMVARSSLEALFKVYWVILGENKEIRNERAYQLEGKPFSDFEKEINDQENNLKKSNHYFNVDIVKRNRELIEIFKQNYPYLINEERNFKVPVKKDGNNKDRELSIKGYDLKFSMEYYHFYRSLCIFCHPNPRIRVFLFNYNREYRDTDQAIIDGLLWGAKVYGEIPVYSNSLLNSYPNHNKRVEISHNIIKYIESYILENDL